jgi:hypothetical protein
MYSAVHQLSPRSFEAAQSGQAGLKSFRFTWCRVWRDNKPPRICPSLSDSGVFILDMSLRGPYIWPYIFPVILPTRLCAAFVCGRFLIRSSSPLSTFFFPWIFPCVMPPFLQFSICSGLPGLIEKIPKPLVLEMGPCARPPARDCSNVNFRGICVPTKKAAVLAAFGCYPIRNVMGLFENFVASARGADGAETSRSRYF